MVSVKNSSKKCFRILPPPLHTTFPKYILKVGKTMKNGHFRITLMKRIKRGSNQTETERGRKYSDTSMYCTNTLHT